MLAKVQNGASLRAFACLLLVTGLAVTGCAPSPPGLWGGAANSATPATPWRPKNPATQPLAARTPASAVVQGGSPRSALTLADAVDIALRNNPATRLAWAQARDAAAQYGASRGEWFPTLDGRGTFTRLKTVASQGRSAVEQNSYGPSLELSWLLLDVGGRSGRIESSKQALVAANRLHDATIQDVVLEVESAYFQFVAQRSLFEAQHVSFAEADTNLAVTEKRRAAGVATIAEVLQARTARAQARLSAERTEGDLQTARGLVALALGDPSHLDYDVDITAEAVPIAAIADSVDALVASATEARPDLAAARARVFAAEAEVRAARGARLPSLDLNANTGRTYTSALGRGAGSYNMTFGATVPLFSGFTAEYRQQSAAARADASRAAFDRLQQQVAFQVFQSYYALRTARQRVHTAEELLAAATQSAEVARAQYKAGVGSVLDLLNAQSALATARSERVDARLTWHTALVQLAHDTGRLDERGQTGLRLAPDSTDTESP